MEMIFVGALVLLGVLLVAAAVIDITARRRGRRLRVEADARDIYGKRHYRPLPPQVDENGGGPAWPGSL